MANGLSRQELLSLARVGAEARIAQLQLEIDAIRAAFAGSGAVKTVTKGTRKRSKLSAAGRANIVAAQKARWAAKKSKDAAPKPKAKRNMSAAGRKKIADAAKARWAKWRAEKKKAEKKK